MSTVEFQHRETSEQWQKALAGDAVAGFGKIVVDFFDEGCSRRQPWTERPSAAAMLAEVERADRRFDAIVVGEFERAFYRDQFQRLAPLLDQHQVPLWLAELSGPVDRSDPTHAALLILLGSQSKREVLRSRHRVMAAMRAQTLEQGRYLGGRPPYGYRLVDAGPHPNPAHASWGRRLQRLESDPATAPHVTWIFHRRLAGYSMASIARTLNSRSVPCPSATDPERNPHRHTTGWQVRSVAAILSNPRYTGYQVWNRQRTDRDPAEPHALNSERAAVHRWNPNSAWTISKRPAHTALISDDDFIAAQAIRLAPTADTDEPREYGLTGLIRCGDCGRRMDSHWAYRSAAYRCRHGSNSATAPTTRIRNNYVRELMLVAYAAAELEVVPDVKVIRETLRGSNMIIECGAGGLRLADSSERPPAKVKRLLGG